VILAAVPLCTEVVRKTLHGKSLIEDLRLNEMRRNDDQWSYSSQYQKGPGLGFLG
jgi:hypothetical protein